jgi:hypothetical protein
MKELSMEGAFLDAKDYRKITCEVILLSWMKAQIKNNAGDIFFKKDIPCIEWRRFFD